MQRYLLTIRRYAIVSVSARVLGVAGILFFLTVDLVWTPRKYWILVGLAIVLLVQLFLLWRIWAGRMKKINATIEELSAM